MATTTTIQGRTTCPLCDDYSGPPESVEAHISRKTDPDHKGEVGRSHRAVLQPDVEPASDGDESTESSSRPDVEVEPVESTDGGLEDAQEAETAGIGIPVSSQAVLMGASLFLLLALLYAWRKGGDQSTDEAEQSQQSQQRQQTPGGGLVTEG